MGKFIVDYRFSARSSRTIEATSKDEATERIAGEINCDDFEMEADEIDDVDFDVRELHPVTRDGKEIWTTYVLKHDVRGHQSALDSSPLFRGRE